jgi:CRP/FNR family transcriptional regulator, cyclic AMP receptor protein
MDHRRSRFSGGISFGVRMNAFTPPITVGSMVTPRFSRASRRACAPASASLLTLHPDGGTIGRLAGILWRLLSPRHRRCERDQLDTGDQWSTNSSAARSKPRTCRGVRGILATRRACYEKQKKAPVRSQGFSVRVNGGRAISKYLKDELVFTQGEPADSVFYIQSGKIKKTVLSEQGKEAVVALLGTGDFFGEGCLTGEPLRLATVSAMTECVIVRISKADITRVIHKEPAFAELFIAHLLARNIRVEEDLVDQLFNSSEKRLARVLLLLANFGKEGRPEPIIAKITQETLAEMIGTTRARVSFFMRPIQQRSATGRFLALKKTSRGVR